MKKKFRAAKLSKKSLEMVMLIKGIIEGYTEKNYKLTLRQLYYQLVGKDIIPNQHKEYAKLSNMLKEARLGGIIDWDGIEDRLRVPTMPLTFNGIKDAVDTILYHFQIDRTEGQRNYLELWVEKDALSEVVKKVCKPYQVPVLVNRGYGSVSAMYDAYKRFSRQIYLGKNIIILYTGDHDPSGMDMVRDIKARITEMLVNDELFKWYLSNIGQTDNYKNAFGEEEKEVYARQFIDFIDSKFTIECIALTDEQIETYNPPPNPTKVDDPRAADYIEKYGYECWEVDALDIEVLYDIIETNIKKYLDLDLYEEMLEKERNEKQLFTTIIDENF